MSQSATRYYASPRRDIPGETPETARLSAMVVALLQELAITRDRLDTVERLLDEENLIPRARVEAYKAQGEAEQERDAIRRRLIAVVMQPLKDDAERTREAVRNGLSTHEADTILDKEISR